MFVISDNISNFNSDYCYQYPSYLKNHLRQRNYSNFRIS